MFIGCLCSCEVSSWVCRKGVVVDGFVLLCVILLVMCVGFICGFMLVRWCIM